MKTFIYASLVTLTANMSFAQPLHIELDMPSIQSHQGNFKAVSGGNMTHWKTFALDYAQSQKMNNQHYADSQSSSDGSANSNTASIHAGAGSINVIIQQNSGTSIAVAEGK